MQTICKHLTEPPPKLSSFCQVPSVLEEIVQRCLEKEPEKRFQSIGELADALRKAYIVCVNAPLAPEEDDSTKKITAPLPSASSQPTEPVIVPSPATGGKSSSGALIAVAVAAVIGIACAAGIPYLLNRDAGSSGEEPAVGAVRQQVKTAETEPNPTVTPSNPETESATSTETTATATTTESPPSVPVSTTTGDTTALQPANSSTTPKKTDTDPPAPAAGEKNNKEATKPAPAEPSEKTTEIVANAKPADKDKKVPEVTGKSEPPVSSAAKTANPIDAQQEEEQRLLSQAKSGVSTAKERVDGLIGGSSVWSVDWNSFDKTALEKVNYYGFDRVKEAVESICQDNIGKESLKGKLKKIVFRNIKQASKKQVSFKDGVLDLQASWSIDDWDNLPSVRDVVQTIENGL